MASVAGVATAAVDLNAPPFSGAGAGVRRYVQFRYEDPSGGPAGINFSNAAELKPCE